MVNRLTPQKIKSFNERLLTLDSIRAEIDRVQQLKQLYPESANKLFVAIVSTSPLRQTPRADGTADVHYHLTDEQCSYYELPLTVEKLLSQVLNGLRDKLKAQKKLLQDDGVEIE